MEFVSPSPKSQSQDVGDPVDSSVNWTVRGAVPEVGDAKNNATGSAEDVVVVPAFTVIEVVCVLVALGRTPPSPIVSDTV